MTPCNHSATFDDAVTLNFFNVYNFFLKTLITIFFENIVWFSCLIDIYNNHIIK
jgi:hypothetical protein